jgi:hypothetical protein
VISGEVMRADSCVRDGDDVVQKVGWVVSEDLLFPMPSQMAGVVVPRLVKSLQNVTSENLLGHVVISQWRYWVHNPCEPSCIGRGVTTSMVNTIGTQYSRLDACGLYQRDIIKMPKRKAKELESEEPRRSGRRKSTVKEEPQEGKPMFTKKSKTKKEAKGEKGGEDEVITNKKTRVALEVAEEKKVDIDVSFIIILEFSSFLQNPSESHGFNFFPNQVNPPNLKWCHHVSFNSFSRRFFVVLTNYIHYSCLLENRKTNQ